MAIVAASLLFGYLAIPYITVYPTRWAVDRLSRANAGEFALGVIAIVIGLLMGLLVGVPLSNLGGAAGRCCRWPWPSSWPWSCCGQPSTSGTC